jgi:hypothetical protein
MPAIPFQHEIKKWYINQENEKNCLLIQEIEQKSMHQKHLINGNGQTLGDVHKYFVKFSSNDHENFFIPKAISQIFFPQITEDAQFFSMPATSVNHMMKALIESCADEFWDLTVTDLIHLLRASRILVGTCGAMKHVHDCAAKILNWRIIQAYDVSAADDFMQLSFLLSAEDGADIAWSQLNMSKKWDAKSLEIPFGTKHTVNEHEFRDRGLIIVFGSGNEERVLKVAVDVHVARLRSVFIHGLLSFSCEATDRLPELNLKNICTQEAREVYLNFLLYGLMPDCVSIECALQLWEVTEWMQVRFI